jgi:cytochrome b pre-mRNA-processing protein 3
MLTRWLRKRRARREAAGALYARIVGQARAPEFYAELAVADTLDGRFDMIVLHAFLALRRLRREGGEANELAQALLDAMFADFDRSLRELGVSDHSIARRMKDMMKASYGRLAAYERGLAADGDLAAALLRNVYRGDRARRPQAERLAGYLRRSMLAVELLPLPRILAGELAFAAVQER